MDGHSYLIQTESIPEPHLARILGRFLNFHHSTPSKPNLWRTD